MVFTTSFEMDGNTPAMTGLATATRAPTSSATGLPFAGGSNPVL
jgi:hypothetical protein